MTRMSTKELRRQDQIQSPSTGVVKRRLSVFPTEDAESAMLRGENSVLKKKLNRYESKETQLKVQLIPFIYANPRKHNSRETGYPVLSIPIQGNTTHSTQVTLFYQYKSKEKPIQGTQVTP